MPLKKSEKQKVCPPPIVFWENVPGVLNTKDNAFGCFMGNLSGGDFPFEIPAGRWESSGFISGAQRQVAWRVLDAQYFGVPQRRKRVFVIASSREGFDPKKILFELQGVCRDSQKGKSEKQDSPGFAEGSFGTFRQTGIAGTCKAKGGFWGGGSETIVLDIAHRYQAIRDCGNMVPTLTARMGTGGNNVPCLMDSSGKFLHTVINKTGTLLASAVSAIDHRYLFGGKHHRPSADERRKRFGVFGKPELHTERHRSTRGLLAFQGEKTYSQRV